VEISRESPREGGVDDGGEGLEVNFERRPGAGGTLWSIEEESQLVPEEEELAWVVAIGKVSTFELDFNHAARVAGSTGQTSAGASVSFAMFLFVQ